MNINEADPTDSLISRTNTDNWMRFSLFSLLQQKAFIFILKKLPLHMTFKDNDRLTPQGHRRK